PKHASSNGRIVVAFLFGLFHGLGFASGLLEVMHAMPTHLIFYSLLGFSIGVEAGNQLVLLPLHGIMQMTKRFQTKNIRQTRPVNLQRIASGAVAAAGVYYLCIAIITHI
ncbi:MAG TPA: HupE/UreJ family protein, partial [Puia sp.]|nr:HupE/UreJ family protein [Puia sp.]